MTYRIETKATMKEYNDDKWWIDRDVIGAVEIEADSVTEALDRWVDVCEERGVTVSRNAMKTKTPLYRDMDLGGGKIKMYQIGYVITASTDFEDRDHGRYVKEYIDLWTVIKTVSYANFEEVA